MSKGVTSAFLAEQSILPSILILSEDEAIGRGIEVTLVESLEFPVRFQRTSFISYVESGDCAPETILVLRANELSLRNEKVLAAMNRRLPLMVLQGPREMPALGVILAQRGVAAYVSDTCDLAALATAVTKVAAGARNLTIGLKNVRTIRAARRIEDSLRMRDPALEPRAALSLRETQIIRDFALGRSMKEIGNRLGISPKTAETYKRRAMRKLRCISRADVLSCGRASALGDMLVPR